MDVSLVVLGSCLVLFAAVLAFVGVSYQPESTPLIPARAQGFGVLAKAAGVTGALVVGLGALGIGGLVAAGVAIAAARVARL